MNPETPSTTSPPPEAEANLPEEMTLQDEVEGLKSAVDTVMRALKIALREHNQAVSREGVLLDMLRQAEAEFAEAHGLLRRFHAAATADAGDRSSLTLLLSELEERPWFGEDEDAAEPEDASTDEEGEAPQG